MNENKNKTKKKSKEKIVQIDELQAYINRIGNCNKNIFGFEENSKNGDCMNFSNGSEIGNETNININSIQLDQTNNRNEITTNISNISNSVTSSSSGSSKGRSGSMCSMNSMRSMSTMTTKSLNDNGNDNSMNHVDNMDGNEKKLLQTTEAKEEGRQSSKKKCEIDTKQDTKNKDIYDDKRKENNMNNNCDSKSKNNNDNCSSENANIDIDIDIDSSLNNNQVVNNWELTLMSMPKLEKSENINSNSNSNYNCNDNDNDDDNSNCININTGLNVNYNVSRIATLGGPTFTGINGSINSISTNEIYDNVNDGVDIGSENKTENFDYDTLQFLTQLRSHRNSLATTDNVNISSINSSVNSSINLNNSSGIDSTVASVANTNDLSMSLNNNYTTANVRGSSDHNNIANGANDIKAKSKMSNAKIKHLVDFLAYS